MRVAVVGEGSDDRHLVAIIEWMARELEIDAEVVWGGHGHDIARSVADAEVSTDPDIICVHRDADSRAGRDARRTEIRDKTRAAAAMIVCAVPVQELEAWLLFDESAIRRAVSKPKGRAELGLPALSAIERRAHPKEILESALRTAAEFGAGSRAARNFHFGKTKAALVGLIDDFARLRELSAFSEFETDFRDAVSKVAA
jgi:hypothetical protein